MLPLILLAAASMASSAAQQTGQIKANISENIAQNKAIIDFNTATSVRGAYRIGLARVGLAQQQKALALQTNQAREAGLNAESEVVANNAATGAVGASAVAVQTDVAQRVGEFEAAQAANFDTAALNYNTTVQDIAISTRAQIKNPTHLSVPGDFEVLGRAALQGAITAGSAYATSQLSLGLGK